MNAVDVAAVVNAVVDVAGVAAVVANAVVVVVIVVVAVVVVAVVAVVAAAINSEILKNCTIYLLLVAVCLWFCYCSC